MQENVLLSKELLSNFIIIAVISLLGFLTENIWLAFTKGFMDNRNMLFPFLLGDGLAAIAMYALFGTPTNPSFFGKTLEFDSRFLSICYYMFIVFSCVCVGELILGNVVEKIFQIEWWNYTRLPLHIGKYTSVPTSLGFASIITLFMHFCFMPLQNFFMKWDYKILFVIAILLMGIMTLDFLHSGIYMMRHKSLMKLWRVDMKGSKIYTLLHT